jgi:UDP:flavonoid glycosyltransferase YjiC (YdhE family)
LNAAAIPAAGAGITLMPDQVHADAVRDAVGRLLADDSFRDVARRVSTSIAAMPSPDDVGAVLETLLAGA